MRITIFFGGTNKERLVSVATAQALHQALPDADLWFWHVADTVHEVTSQKLLGHARPFEDDFKPDTLGIELEQALDSVVDVGDFGEDLGDQRIRHHAGKSVGAEQIDVVGLDAVLGDVGGHDGLDAERPRQVAHITCRKHRGGQLIEFFLFKRRNPAGRDPRRRRQLVNRQSFALAQSAKRCAKVRSDR